MRVARRLQLRVQPRIRGHTTQSPSSLYAPMGTVAVDYRLIKLPRASEDCGSLLFSPAHRLKIDTLPGHDTRLVRVLDLLHLGH